MRNILITGGAGFIASCLAEKLLTDPENFIVIVDNLTTGHLSKLPKTQTDRWKFIKCDANNYVEMSTIMTSYRFDYVFHYAALVGVIRTQQNPVKVLQDIDGIRNICTLSKNTGVKRLFFSSSSEIYGEPVEIPQNAHTTPLNSRLPYAIVKNVGEAYLRSFHQEYNLDYTIFRFFNTYGSKQSSDFVMSKFISKALANQNIGVYGDGSQTRTFCYIDDNIEACINAFTQNKIVNDVVNIGGDKEISIKYLAETIIRLTNSQSKIIYLPPLKDGDMTRRCPDNSVMKKELLKRDLISLEEGINKILNNGIHVIPNDIV